MKSAFHNSLFCLLVLAFLALACNKQQSVSELNMQSKQIQQSLVIDSLPTPDHIVIVIEENHAYSQIIGSGDAPYINLFANGSSAAIFTNSYGITHPSQPNYLAIYSGSIQGVTNDDNPPGDPFTTANLGSQLIKAGKSFATFSESLPGIGYNGNSYGAYVRKHNPAANWMGTGKNQIPASTNQPFTAFPTDYTKLPAVCIVVPNENNDMHDGSVSRGDAWLKSHLDGYIKWSRTNNSLFILTFDEDDYSKSNHIATVFYGSMVKKGQYTSKINHYNILRTIEDMYGLPYAGSAANVTTINYCWK
jgi:hypothetical protein